MEANGLLLTVTFLLLGIQSAHSILARLKLTSEPIDFPFLRRNLAAELFYQCNLGAALFQPLFFVIFVFLDITA